MNENSVMNEPTGPHRRAEPTVGEDELLDGAINDVTALMYAAHQTDAAVVRRALLDAAGTRITEVLYPVNRDASVEDQL